MKFKSYEKIYVQLEDWTGCVPTQGKYISDDIFELQESEEFPSDDDEWVFKPGDIVRCVVVTKKNAHKYHLAKDGFEWRKSILFAYEKVED